MDNWKFSVASLLFINIKAFTSLFQLQFEQFQYMSFQGGGGGGLRKL